MRGSGMTDAPLIPGTRAPKAKHSGRDREALDWYREPRWAVEALFGTLPILGPVLDPAAGGGTIPDVARSRGIEAWGTDLAHRDVPGVIGGHDFLNQRTCLQPVDIVSNPPYKHAVAWLHRSLEVASHRVCLLVRNDFLSSQDRYGLFKGTPVEGVLILSRRPSMPPGPADPDEAKGGQHDFCWIVWNKTLPEAHRPWIDWLDPDRWMPPHLATKRGTMETSNEAN